MSGCFLTLAANAVQFLEIACLKDQLNAVDFSFVHIPSLSLNDIEDTAKPILTIVYGFKVLNLTSVK